MSHNRDLFALLDRVREASVPGPNCGVVLRGPLLLLGFGKPIGHSAAISAFCEDERPWSGFLGWPVGPPLPFGSTIKVTFPPQPLRIGWEPQAPPRMVWARVLCIAHMLAHIYVYIYTYIYICTHAYRYASACTYTHIHNASTA